HRLNGQNYPQWSQSVMMFISGKGKDDYLTSAAAPPPKGDPKFKSWRAENNMVISQGDLTVTQYFNTLSRYWQQLDIFEELDWECPGDHLKYMKIMEKEMIVKFLVGRNKNLDKVRGRIFGKKPLPSLRE
ncbi:UBN2_3 domain-containing protein, partial [Cephalotus follicularis]